MKTRIRVIELALCICAAFGWWGVFYPELTMTPDTYRIVREDAQDGEIQRAEDWDFDREIYSEILQADAGQVRFKSKLLMSLKEIFE
ncbi:MAG: hypothetical protein NC251_02425 [Lachnoclostridium sp.]|nr:hypothetical protein [Lachnospira sp.]MCM1247266.1 hypothetical protein [Lachnoclostridium sp.]MCM1536147.1 hypothetical protein [Clostridium sp.]